MSFTKVGIRSFDELTEVDELFLKARRDLLKKQKLTKEQHKAISMRTAQLIADILEKVRGNCEELPDGFSFSGEPGQVLRPVSKDDLERSVDETGAKVLEHRRNTLKRYRKANEDYYTSLGQEIEAAVAQEEEPPTDNHEELEAGGEVHGDYRMPPQYIIEEKVVDFCKDVTGLAPRLQATLERSRNVQQAMGAAFADEAKTTLKARHPIEASVLAGAAVSKSQERHQSAEGSIASSLRPTPYKKPRI